jgi:hypothetical protein
VPTRWSPLSSTARIMALPSPVETPVIIQRRGTELFISELYSMHEMRVIVLVQDDPAQVQA